MLESPPNQAAGLLDFAVPQTPRLAAMVSHGDEHAELPLLLRVCAALVSFGYMVTVLDGSVLETQENPGLEQLLNFSLPTIDHGDAPGWHIMPAALGLQSLSAAHEHGGPSIVDCGSFFPHESIVIAYASAQSLTPLLRGSNVRPLLPISGAKTSLLTSYLALKRMLLKAKVEPTVVNVTGHDEEALPEAPPWTSLGDCARFFLNYEVTPLQVTLPAGNERYNAAISRLSLGLLESALPLESSWSNAGQRNRQSFSMPMAAGRH
jgi:hypothetical protein